MKILTAISSLVFGLLLLLAESLFWVSHALSQTLSVGRDLLTARATIKDGELHCPRGHLIPTDGEELVWRCSACNFTFAGPQWICSNPECPAPSTPYTDCPTCGLSVRSPYRWGRP